MGKKRNLVVALYSHPEYLPPTLNALEQLSLQYEHIFIVHRNVEGFDWQYPSNVTLISTGETLSVREAERKPTLYKIRSFLAFSRLMARTYNTHKASALLIYDYIPILSYRIVRFFMRKPSMLWYHNHDTAEKEYVRKWSIAWWAWRSENWIFPLLDIFSLPAMERQVCFPMNTLRGKFLFLPNFPSKKVYKRGLKKEAGQVIRILYQGSIGPEHGLEEIISLMDRPVNNKQINLVLKGFISPEYKEQLELLATKTGVRSQLIFIGPTGYRGVIENAYTCHIGIGIHKKLDIMNKTLGTASNKIYEYAAAGLPVLLFDNMHFREHLQKYEWALFTDCSEASLIECIAFACDRFDQLSAMARADFEKQLNFEYYFDQVNAYLQLKG